MQFEMNPNKYLGVTQQKIKIFIGNALFEHLCHNEGTNDLFKVARPKNATNNWRIIMQSLMEINITHPSHIVSSLKQMAVGARSSPASNNKIIYRFGVKHALCRKQFKLLALFSASKLACKETRQAIIVKPEPTFTKQITMSKLTNHNQTEAELPFSNNELWQI